MVNNAGTSNHDKILDITPTTLDSLYEVHVKAVVFLTQVLTPLQNDGGVIINTSSGLTRLTFPGSGLYGMLKAAVETLTRYMAIEFADRKIRVNVVAPGPMQLASVVWMIMLNNKGCLLIMRHWDALVSLKTLPK